MYVCRRAGMSGSISIRGLKKKYGQEQIFADFNLELTGNSIAAIFGPNGSGKSTLLNILSGVVQADAGIVRVENRDQFSSSYIFQNYRESLLPWRTNSANLALPLNIQKKSSREIRQRIAELEKIFEPDFDMYAYPYELSGGQQQVLACMRALITMPQILFIDEPFSALDYENNLRLRQHLQTYFLLHAPTIVMVTHNIEEAVHVADQIVVLSQKPTTVLEVVDNPMAHPRTVDVLKTEEFHAVKDRVLSIFQRAAQV